jgi:hypothetical protein
MRVGPGSVPVRRAFVTGFERSVVVGLGTPRRFQVVAKADGAKCRLLSPLVVWFVVNPAKSRATTRGETPFQGGVS